MQIQVNSDHNIQCHEPLANKIRGTVESALSHFKDQITQVEVYLSDENSDKKVGYHEIHCVLEARIEGRPAIAVTDQANTVELAVDGAAEKLAKLIEHTLGRLRDHRHQPRPHEPNTLGKP